MFISDLIRKNLFLLLILYVYSDIHYIYHTLISSSFGTVLPASSSTSSSSSSSSSFLPVSSSLVVPLRLPFYVSGTPVLSNRKKGNNVNNRVISGRNNNNKGGGGKSSTLAVWKQIKNECERTPACKNLPLHFEENCLLQCQAPGCYQAIFAENPLEPGEIDSKRSATYSRCLKEFENRLRKANLWPPTISSATGTVEEPPVVVSPPETGSTPPTTMETNPTNPSEVPSTTTTTPSVTMIKDENSEKEEKTSDNEDEVDASSSFYASASPSAFGTSVDDTTGIVTSRNGGNHYE